VECKINNNQHFKISGISGSDYAKDIVTRKIGSRYTVFCKKSLISTRSKIQECVTLSVTEAALMTLIALVQEMIHVKKVIESMKLKFKLPMEIQNESKVAKDLVNNWSIGRRTRDFGVRLKHLRKLKEIGIIELKLVIRFLDHRYSICSAKNLDLEMLTLIPAVESLARTIFNLSRRSLKMLFVSIYKSS
jgi:hypothetical protein